jgi:VIT1/CCC1 family predicted Fe2+/Mn2+ transporter
MTAISEAQPLQAAFASFISFVLGAALPLLVALFAPLQQMVYWQYAFSIAFLILLGSVAAKAGGSPLVKSAIRIVLWGTIAMAASAAIGHLLGTNVL